MKLPVSTQPPPGIAVMPCAPALLLLTLSPKPRDHWQASELPRRSRTKPSEPRPDLFRLH
jgi:hypothetical protein